MAVRAAANRLPVYRPFHFPNPSISSPLRIPCFPRNLQHILRCQVTTNSNPKLESAAQLEDKNQSSNDWKIKMLYDGDCPLCMREVNMLRKRNERYKAIKFVDVSLEDYSPSENQGLDYETVMGRIHAILSNGTVVRDVEIAALADSVYGVWAKYRLQITGRPPLDNILEARKKKAGEACTDDNVCKM